MHLSNSIDCVFQGSYGVILLSPVTNLTQLNPATTVILPLVLWLTNKKHLSPPWDFHSASVLDPLRLCYLSSRARESKMSTSPGWKLNQSRPKSSQNWEIYTWKEPSNLSSSPKLESSPQGLNLSFTLPSLRRHFPVSVWWSSGDQEHTPSLGK